MHYSTAYYIDAAVAVVAAAASAATAAALAVVAPTVAEPSVAVAVLVALTAAWTCRVARRAVRAARWYVPGIAVVAAAVGAAMAGPLPWLGRAAFVLLAAAVAGLRGAGGRKGAVAVLATGPLAAAVAVPLPAGSGSGPVALVLAAAMLAAMAWAVGLTALARRPIPPTRAPTSRPSTTQAPTSRQPGTWAATSRQPGTWAPMARRGAAVGFAVGGAFLLAAALLPAHSSWAPLTALVVGAGADTWHDAARRGVRRLGGATAGAVLGTLALLVPHGPAYPGLLAAVVLVGATWLRPAGYAWWAGGLTAALVLLAGETGPAGRLDLGFAAARIAAIAAGGVLAIASAGVLLPRPAVADGPAGATGRS